MCAWKPGATALVATLSVSCAPPTADDLLSRSREAIQSLPSAAYRYSYEGSGSVAGSYVGVVRLIRRQNGPPLYLAELRPSPSYDPVLDGSDPSSPPPALFLSYGGEHVAALDEALRTFSFGTVSGGSGHLVADAPFAVLSELAETIPFDGEPTGALTVEGREVIGGVLCDVIRGTDPDFAADVWWYIGVEDHLPHAYRWISRQPELEGEFFFQIEELDVETQLPMQSLQLSQRPGDAVLDQDTLRIEAGAPAPDWTLRGPSGEPVRLSDLRGSVVVLDLSASWCAACGALYPEYGRLAREYADRGVRFLGIAAWERPGISTDSIRRTLGGEYVGLQHGQRLAASYELAELPALFVVDASGELVHVRNPVREEPAQVIEELEAAIRSSVGTPPER